MKKGTIEGINEQVNLWTWMNEWMNKAPTIYRANVWKKNSRMGYICMYICICMYVCTNMYCMWWLTLHYVCTNVAENANLSLTFITFVLSLSSTSILTPFHSSPDDPFFLSSNPLRIYVALTCMLFFFCMWKLQKKNQPHKKKDIYIIKSSSKKKERSESIHTYLDERER